MLLKLLTSIIYIIFFRHQTFFIYFIFFIRSFSETLLNIRYYNIYNRLLVLLF